MRQGRSPERIAVGPRIGVDYAAPADVAAPWRLAHADTRWVSHRTKLKIPDPEAADAVP